MGVREEDLDGTITATVVVMMTTTKLLVVDGAAIIIAVTIDSVEADQRNEKNGHPEVGVLGTTIGPARLQQIETTVVTENANEPDPCRLHLR